MNIAFGILAVMVVYLFFRNSNLKSENKFLKTGKREAENSLSIYFNQLIQYRDVLIRNNLSVPDNNQLKTDKMDTKSFTVDEILDEITEKGIDNVSKDKLDFLKNKQDGKDN